jgi:hypothetical protein
MNRPNLRRLRFLVLLLTVACSAKNDGPADPGPGPGDGSVVLLDASNPAEWSCSAGGEGCPGYCRIEGGVMATHDTTLLQTPSFPAQPYCSSRAGQCQWRSTHNIDLRSHATARVQFESRQPRSPMVAPPASSVKVRVASRTYPVPQTSLQQTKTLQSSRRGMESRLRYLTRERARLLEATIEVALRYYHSVSPTLYDNPRRCEGVSEAYVREFQIVGRRR